VTSHSFRFPTKLVFNRK